MNLNIRGLYSPTISKNLLTSVPDSILEAFFSGRHQTLKVENRIFIDRDPDMFKHIIRYLENGWKLVKFDSA